MNHISVFVSSTFNDMQSERDLIREKIAPELEKHIARLNYTVDFIDLRWGINTQSVSENEANKKILRTCFSEIRKTKPFFIALIGERYGWIPERSDVLDAFRSEGLEADEDTDKSITELEITCATKLYARKNRCFFYFRDDVDYGADDAARRTFVSDSEQKARIDALKKGIETEFSGQTRSYSADWDASRQRIVGLSRFEEQLYTDLLAAIDDELATVAKPDNSVEESINITDAAIATMSETFSGRRDELSRIDDFLGSQNRLLCLTGESGSGKSSLMAKIADSSARNDRLVVPFFVGADDFSVTVENMLKSAIVRLSRHLGTEPTFDPHATEFDFGRLQSDFFALLNKAALGGEVILLVDALNQLLSSPLEEKLKWLNLFALSPNVKVIVSCTRDYYGLGILKAMGAELLSLEYFSSPDIAEVTERYFAVNHKEVNPKVVAAITGKRSGETQLCSLPVYLLTILQQLNNIDGDDFAAIHNRESSLGEAAGDAIINYLTEIVTSAPDDIGALLDETMKRVARKVGDIANLFTGIIALSRRGITERYIEKLCAHLGVPFDSMSFSYYRKLMKSSLSERENGAWDFNHALIKTHFRAALKGETEAAIVGGMAKILSEEDDAAPFKKSDYAYWLGLGDRLDLFVPYFNRLKSDPTVSEAFLGELQANPSDATTKLLFPATDDTRAIWDFLTAGIRNGSFSHADSNALGCKLLNSVYSFDFMDRTDKLGTVLAVYIALALSSRRAGYNRLAIDYLGVARKLSKTLGDLRSDVLICSELSECYFALGKGLKSLKFRKEAIATCEKCGTEEELLAETYLACVQSTKGLVRRYKPIRERLQAMLDIVGRGTLPEERSVFWSIRILRLAELINMPIGELGTAVSVCEEYLGSDDPMMCAEAAYALALTHYSASPERSGVFLARARELIEAALKLGSDAERLTLYHEILAFELFTARCVRCDTTALEDENARCLQLLLAINPTFETADELLGAKRGDGEAKKLRRRLSRGLIPAEQKVINKILLAIAVTVASIFLFIMPIFFSVFRRYVGLVYRNSSLYSVFVNYYVAATIETLFNMFAGFAFYGLIRLVRVDHDYLTKRLWLRRTCIFFAAAAVIFATHVIDWGFMRDFSATNNFDYLPVGLPYLMLLFMEVVPGVLIAFTVMDYVASGSLSRSRRVNSERFLLSYKRNMINLLEEVGFYALSFGLFYLFYGINTSNKYTGMLLYSSEVYNYIMIALAALLVAKAVYYTIIFLRLRKSHAETNKN